MNSTAMHPNFPFDTEAHTTGKWHAWCDALHYAKTESEREGWSTVSDETKVRALEAARQDERWSR